MKDKVFKEIFDRYYPDLCRNAYKYLNDVEAAEDAVQEVLIHLWETKKALLDPDHVKGYLMVSVRNKCISLLRKKIFVTTGVDLPDYAETPEEEEVTDIDPATLVAQALAELPPKCREIFELSRLKQLSYKEIAAELGISVKTVENQMSTAIRKLRDFARNNPVYMIILFSLLFMPATDRCFY